MSVAMRDAFGAKLTELGKTNDKLVVLDADVSSSTKSGLFGKAFPDRFFNVGVAEANLVGVAAGLAANGYHPVVNAFAIFLALKSLDQIRNVFCYNKLPIVIAGAYGGLSDSFDGASHQSISDIALMRVMPNMEVIVPADSRQAELALEYALTRKNPVYIRLNRNAMPAVAEPADFGAKKVITLKEGKDVTIAANGITTSMVMDAVALLEKKGIDAEVLSIPFVKPLDAEGLAASVKKTGRLVTVEEHLVAGGFGSACLEGLSKMKMTYDFDAIGIEDRFTETGPYDALLAKYGLSAEAITERVVTLCGKN
ncbi:MAG: 1-deoxy-D-xylulose-5-phosphate synthase [Spirochaetia bacterium]|nr:1-deoxy-D-xylulose-5-phosphate synthase [Spirochaetia bacterium]